jgi:hypothetical protein
VTLSARSAQRVPQGPQEPARHDQLLQVRIRRRYDDAQPATHRPLGAGGVEGQQEGQQPDAPPNPQACLSRRFGPVAMARDAVFLMGDNRAASNDSRCAGPVPVSSVFAIMTGGRG